MENNFEAIAREWFAKHSPNWAPTHADKIINGLENDVFPWLGKRPIAGRVEIRGVENEDPPRGRLFFRAD